MNRQQLNAIRYAYLDLLGSWEAYENGDPMSHDWKAHRTTLIDLEDCFYGELKDLIKENEQ
jgi:hypothetical protein